MQKQFDNEVDIFGVIRYSGIEKHKTQKIQKGGIYMSIKEWLIKKLEIFGSYKPFGCDFKKNLLNNLKETRKDLPSGNQANTGNKQGPSWELSKEEKKEDNSKGNIINKQYISGQN